MTVQFENSPHGGVLETKLWKGLFGTSMDDFTKLVGYISRNIK